MNCYLGIEIIQHQKESPGHIFFRLLYIFLMLWKKVQIIIKHSAIYYTFGDVNSCLGIEILHHQKVSPGHTFLISLYIFLMLWKKKYSVLKEMGEGDQTNFSKVCSHTFGKRLSLKSPWIPFIQKNRISQNVFRILLCFWFSARLQ